jgi:hypothetical protein
MKEVASLPNGETVVSMVIRNEKVIVATNKHVYVMGDDFVMRRVLFESYDVAPCKTPSERFEELIPINKPGNAMVTKEQIIQKSNYKKALAAEEASEKPLSIVSSFEPKKDAIILILDPMGGWHVRLECLNKKSLPVLEEKVKRILLFGDL